MSIVPTAETNTANLFSRAAHVRSVTSLTTFTAPNTLVIFKIPFNRVISDGKRLLLRKAGNRKIRLGHTQKGFTELKWRGGVLHAVYI